MLHHASPMTYVAFFHVLVQIGPGGEHQTHFCSKWSGFLPMDCHHFTNSWCQLLVLRPRDLVAQPPVPPTVRLKDRALQTRTDQLIEGCVLFCSRFGSSGGAVQT